MAETMKPKTRRLKPGEEVVLIEVPPGLVTGLPQSDQLAIKMIAGKPVDFLSFRRSDGKAELQFVDKKGVIHFIWVDPKYIRPA
jgi:ribosomal protein S18 acetylase RimI-like enzyme